MGFVAHVKHIGLTALIMPVLILSASPARAINWEGHQDWFHDSTPFEAFTEGVPPPIAKPKPTCAERARIRAVNVYEQVPVPGVNCVATEDVVPEG
jgi:hypothetical protein